VLFLAERINSRRLRLASLGGTLSRGGQSNVRPMAEPKFTAPIV